MCQQLTSKVGDPIITRRTLADSSVQDCVKNAITVATARRAEREDADAAREVGRHVVRSFYPICDTTHSSPRLDDESTEKTRV